MLKISLVFGDRMAISMLINEANGFSSVFRRHPDAFNRLLIHFNTHTHSSHTKSIKTTIFFLF